jgi:hypothetical protein
MQNQNNTHQQIALAIKGAKKAMLKRSREGMNMRVAAEGFISEVAVCFAGIVPDFAPDEYERPDPTPAEAVEVSTRDLPRPPLGR